jgi:hypothetical protein
LGSFLYSFCGELHTFCYGLYVSENRFIDSLDALLLDAVPHVTFGRFSEAGDCSGVDFL